MLAVAVVVVTAQAVVLVEREEVVRAVHLA
jgi:hypothetical protein